MKIVGTLLLGILQLFYTAENTLLTDIKASGELQIVTRYGLTTYYEGPNGNKVGLEYELAKRFADELGVKLRIKVANNTTEILNLVNNQQVHLAAAGLSITKSRLSLVRFGPHYQNISQQLVYHRGIRPARRLTELTAKHNLTVLSGSHQVNLLKVLQKDYPDLTWKTKSNLLPADLIKQVWQKEIKYALVDSNEIAQLRRFYPKLEIALVLPNENQLAWAFPQMEDNSLYLAAINFFNKIQRSGELKLLIERYYGHIDQLEDFNYYNNHMFQRRIQERLPTYQKTFETIAARYNVDWRLLAAIAYQESHWNPKAVSYTGVKGLMMLTRVTAREVGIRNRKNPIQSIKGGAKYFISMKKRLPKDIREPDRTWFALAAYNVGLGHIIDIRQITKRQGDNPNYWMDVKKHLPKLTNPYWYKQTKYGYARGNEPVQYVKNIRHFYDVLAMADR